MKAFQRFQRRQCAGASLQRIHRHVQHGQIVGHEEGGEFAALERLRETRDVLEAEVRIRIGAWITPRCGYGY
jgi:hypothetical protein